jgi:hypothetical protein
MMPTQADRVFKRAAGNALFNYNQGGASGEEVARSLLSLYRELYADTDKF